MEHTEPPRESFDQRRERRKRERDDRKYDIQFEQEVGDDGTVVKLIKTSLRPQYEEEQRGNVERHLLTQEEYDKGILTIAEHRIELTGDIKVVADALARTREGMAKLSEQEAQSLRRLQQVVHSASLGQSEFFAALPVELQELIERADRALEMHHILTGSTHETPMEHVYPADTSQIYVEDFCRALETNLSKLFNDELAGAGVEQTYRVEIGRPQRPASINAIPNLIATTIDRAVKNLPDSIDATEQRKIAYATIDGALVETVPAYLDAKLGNQQS